MKVYVEIVAFAGFDIDIIIKVLVVAGASDKRISFRVSHGDYICIAGVVEIVRGLRALLRKHSDIEEAWSSEGVNSDSSEQRQRDSGNNGRHVGYGTSNRAPY